MTQATGIIPITDPADPRIAIYREQRDQWRRARHRAWLESRDPEPWMTATGLDPGLDPAADLFIAEGEKVVRQLLTSPHRLVSALISEARLDVYPATLAALAARAPVYTVARDVIEGIAGFDIHRGLLAVGRRVDPGPLPALLAESAACVILEDLANHDNVGGIFRSVRALAPPRPGFAHPACVLMSPRCCDPLYRKALRVSMGNALHVPFAALDPWPAGLAAVRDAGFQLVALDPAEQAVDLRDLALQRPALVMGTEGPGLSAPLMDTLRSLGGHQARIPIDPAADSLNVGVAAALALHRLCPWPVQPAGPSR